MPFSTTGEQILRGFCYSFIYIYIYIKCEASVYMKYSLLTLGQIALSLDVNCHWSVLISQDQLMCCILETRMDINVNKYMKCILVTQKLVHG